MQSMCGKELKALELNKYTTIKELVEYGLDRISDEEMITMNLTDFLYLRRVLEEYMRFFHNPDHYPTIEAVREYLGDVSSGGGFEVLNTALYEKTHKVNLPDEVEKMFAEDMFEHPLYPEYYRENS